MTPQEVVWDIADGVLSIRLNRPERLNALTKPMLDEIARLVDAAATEPGIKAIVIRGSGRAFCAGADLTDGCAPKGLADAVDAAARLVRAIRDSPLPVVSAIQGAAAGVGVSIALAADLTVASKDSYFLLPFTKIGLMPDGGASALVAAAVGRAVAMRMALLAEPIPAGEALALGLIAKVADDLDAGLEQVMATLREGPLVAFARTKHAVNGAALSQLDEALELERSGQAALLAAPDAVEGVAAFIEKRAPAFTDRLAGLE